MCHSCDIATAWRSFWTCESSHCETSSSHWWPSRWSNCPEASRFLHTVNNVNQL